MLFLFLAGCCRIIIELKRGFFCLSLVRIPHFEGSSRSIDQKLCDYSNGQVYMSKKRKLTFPGF